MIEKEYSNKNKDVKKSARQDKRPFIDQMAKIIDEAAERGNLSKTFKTTNHLCGTRTKIALANDKEGKTLFTIQEQASRWVKHFKEIFYQNNPFEIISPPPPEDDLDINSKAPFFRIWKF